MNRYSLTSEALLELDEIWSYIAQDSTEAADRWIAKLLDACKTLARNPYIGHARAEIADPSVLFWPVGTYLVVYRVRNGQVEILGITHGARDIPSFLRNHQE